MIGFKVAMMASFFSVLAMPATGPAATPTKAPVAAPMAAPAKAPAPVAAPIKAADGLAKIAPISPAPKAIGDKSAADAREQYAKAVMDTFGQLFQVISESLGVSRALAVPNAINDEAVKGLKGFKQNVLGADSKKSEAN